MRKKTLYGYALQAQSIGDILQSSPFETSGITFEYEEVSYTLKMSANSEYPKLKLELKSMMSVNDFAANINSGAIASHVKINSVPEPATLMLVGLGAVWMYVEGTV